MATPKKPQDRLPAKAEQPETVDEQSNPEGWDLLKPFDQVPVWDQVELIEIVKPLIPQGEDGEKVEINLSTMDLRIVGELAKRLQEFAVDSEAYLALVSGPNGLINAVNLGFAYAMQLGEFGRSASS